MVETDKLNQHILGLNKRLPRYTSYPTSPKFSQDIGPRIYTKWLREIPDHSSVSLYFHIPYCRQMCWYCGCHTKATKQYDPVRKYVSLLLKEIELIAAELGTPKTVGHIHFGGGSPSILIHDDFDAIMSSVHKLFNLSDEVEIAMELDPRRVTEAKVATYARHGVNRVSLGVQDFNDDVQKAINRVQPFRTVYGAIKHLRTYGIDKINMDLMYGLPKQTCANVDENISKALLLKPDRLAVFGYAHVPWMKKHMRLISEQDLPDAAARLNMFNLSARRLESSGYTAIGLDHFALKGDAMETAVSERNLRRNFQGYTTDLSDAIIGFGPSSIGNFPSGYVQNTLNMKSYERAINSSTPATIKGYRLSDTDRLHHAIIENIMCYLFVDITEICHKYNVNADRFDNVLSSLKDLARNGLIEITDRRISIHPKARQIARYVSAAFDQYHSTGSSRHSQVA